jgi:thioredoxin-like negative regulator of GroEL
VVRAAAQRIAGRGAVVQINTDENPVLAGRFKVSGIPALHLLRGGQSIAAITGGQELERLVTWFDSHIPRP